MGWYQPGQLRQAISYNVNIFNMQNIDSEVSVKNKVTLGYYVNET